MFLILFTLGLSFQAQSGKAVPSHFEDGVSKVVKLYPNPATTKINFEILHSNDKVYEIIVYNFLGKKMDHLKNVGVRTVLNLDNYYSGIYIYQLIDNKGNVVESGKFNVVK
ncbi:T9SS type A sorting domain-containing protein [Chitinophaga caeni]|uniref:T9SS type A sorting domain-containing protein n=1 Tax=Chitinophaga caeni TaxID=2029983 RepID=UPI0012FE5B50|nr:T9SS type A sorting domain-containing protein [Chitinophaga caeni]